MKNNQERKITMNKKMKKYRKIVPALLICAATAAIISACAARGAGGSSGEPQSSVSDHAQSPVSSNSEASQISDVSDISDNHSGNLSQAEQLRQAIADAYGENYLPNMQMTEEILQDEFGLKADMYDEIVAEMPTIGFHPDRLIIVKPKQGKENEVKQALEKARETLVEGSIQYPMNAAKVSAAKVLESDGYYCFMLLGRSDDLSENEEQAAQFADEQIKIGVKAFEDFFAKNR